MPKIFQLNSGLHKSLVLTLAALAIYGDVLTPACLKYMTLLNTNSLNYTLYLVGLLGLKLVFRNAYTFLEYKRKLEMESSEEVQP